MNNTNDYIQINGKKLYNHEFVGLHAHSAFSLFDGFGFPQVHMNFAYENGSRALALTDHGSMNGLSYQLLRAKEMKAEGKDFKPSLVLKHIISNLWMSGRISATRSQQTKSVRKKLNLEILLWWLRMSNAMTSERCLASAISFFSRRI